MAGSPAPGVSTVDVRFSRGGADPLVTLRQESATVSLSWPAALPAPSVEGDTAVYAEVLPGVDLRVLRSDPGDRHGGDDWSVVGYRLVRHRPGQVRWCEQRLVARQRG